MVCNIEWFVKIKGFENQSLWQIINSFVSYKKAISIGIFVSVCFLHFTFVENCAEILVFHQDDRINFKHVSKLIQQSCKSVNLPIVELRL